MDLSIVFGTYNRVGLLKDCVESIRATVGELEYEIIVADGGSTDGSREWLAVQGDVVLLGERHLDGAIIAYNKAFSLARGWATAHLNDDAICFDEVLIRAWRYLKVHKETVGQIAFYYDNGLNGRFGSGDVICGRQTANLGITQTWLGHAVGWWGRRGYTYGGDNELSMQIWKLGYKVVAIPELQVHHLEHFDGLRVHNSGPQRNQDAAAFFNAWTEINVPQNPIPREKIVNSTVIRPW